MPALELLLDFSGSLLLAVYGPGGELRAGRVERDRTRGDRALGMVADLLEEAGGTFADLDALFVGTGPGSFTGLRVAIALAEGLAFRRALPRRSFGSLSALLEARREEDGGSSGASAGAAGRGRRELALLPANSDFLYALKSGGGKPFLLPRAELRAALEEADTVITTGPAPRRADDLWAHPGLRHFEDEVDFSRLRALALRSEPLAEGRLKPLYLLASAAEARADLRAEARVDLQAEARVDLRAAAAADGVAALRVGPLRNGEMEAVLAIERAGNPNPWSEGQFDAYRLSADSSFLTRGAAGAGGPSSPVREAQGAKEEALPVPENGTGPGLGLWAARIPSPEEPAGRLVGFIAFRHLLEEIEIDALGIHPDFRRRGLGRRLVEELLEQAGRAGIRRALLEVRHSNRAARGLYASFGFVETGRRKGYYSGPVEDALLLLLPLPGPSRFLPSHPHFSPGNPP